MGVSRRKRLSLQSLNSGAPESNNVHTEQVKEPGPHNGRTVAGEGRVTGFKDRRGRNIPSPLFSVLEKGEEEGKRLHAPSPESNHQPQLTCAKRTGKAMD